MDAMDESKAVFLILRHPMMWPNAGFVELPARLGFWASVALLPEHAVMRLANHAIDEKKKKAKDDKKARWWAKERAKLDRGKRWQGLDNEEEEEEEGDGSPIE